MTFKYKLSKRLALMRDAAVALAAATFFTCAPGDRTLSPDQPRFALSTSQPSSVTDLNVTAITDTSVTLAFTEVDDGTGWPASYFVRFAVAPLAWGSASDVAQGSCQVPLAGTVIGATRSCTVLGLQRSTTYEFQLVAFRGTLNVNAVFGGLSNIARASTTAGDMPTASPPDTVFVEGFESGSLNAWQDGVDPTRHRVLNDPTLARSGSRVLEVTYPGGTDGGWLTHWFMPGYDSLYVSVYVRFPATWQGGTKLIAFYGSRTDDQWSAFGKAGICPTGTDFFAAMLVSEPAGTLGTRFYTYYPAMAREPDGVTCWGRYGDGSEAYVPPLTMSLGTWHRVEFWVKLNTPGQSDATQTFWTDGAQRGAWAGFSFRSSTILRLNSVQLTFSVTSGVTQTQTLYVDDIVVSTRKPVGAAPVASVTVSPASASVTVGQTLQLTATPKDLSGAVLTGRVVTWVSSAPTVAAVTAGGLVSGVAAGAATITATSEGQSGAAGITVTAVPVASVTVSPASASVTVGQTVQLTATPKDASGNPLTGRVVTWASSAPAVATVTGSGLVSGLTPGSVTITATSEGVPGTAAVAVTATTLGTVTDLAVVGATDTAVTLAFTEVDDGTGWPASYFVRFAVAPLAWGSASDVAQGSCQVPLAGTVIGATRSCTVLGLQRSTTYEFQLVAFRGTLNVNAVFGGLSNIARASTTAQPAAVASVTLSPASAGVTVGQTVQLTATPKDASGTALTGRVVTWASSAPAVATVASSGLVTGVALGTATITATSAGVSGTAAITVTAAPVASVTVSPASASVTVGKTVQLTATPKDASGNPLTGRVVTWASNVPAVATVTSSGLVSGVATGAATITATSEGVSGTAAITVTASKPGTVTDLRVAGVTDSSVTLSFTEVNGGTGQPASYDIRFAMGVISWGAAVDVTRGTCATPVVGTAIGAARTCTVLGLAPSTGYQFQLVAFRGTLNVNAVFGGLSNVASGTTAALPGAPVASVTVSPASAGVTVGQTVQLTATPKDASGNPLAGRVVTWASSAPALATVTSSGLVSGVAAGAATVTATSEGQSGSAAITVTTGSGEPPLHEPAGFQPYNDQPWDVMLSNGWSYLRRTSSIDDGIVLDATAPRSPLDVLRIVFTPSMAPDAEPSVHWIGLPGVRAVYAMWWIKLSPNWTSSPAGGGKITFLWAPSGQGQVYTGFFGSAEPHHISVNTEWAPYGQKIWDPNVTTTPIFYGQWYRIEWYMVWESSPGATDGIMRWWVNGVLNGDYTAVRYPACCFQQFEFAPTLQNPPPATQYMYVDHTYVSIP